MIVAWVGSIMVASMAKNSLSRPGKRRLAKVKPARAEKKRVPIMRTPAR